MIHFLFPFLRSSLFVPAGVVPWKIMRNSHVLKQNSHDRKSKREASHPGYVRQNKHNRTSNSRGRALLPKKGAFLNIPVNTCLWWKQGAGKRALNPDGEAAAEGYCFKRIHVGKEWIISVDSFDMSRTLESFQADNPRILLATLGQLHILPSFYEVKTSLVCFSPGVLHSANIEIKVKVSPGEKVRLTCRCSCPNRGCEHARSQRRAGSGSGCFWGWKGAPRAPGTRWWRCRFQCDASAATGRFWKVSQYIIFASI